MTLYRILRNPNSWVLRYRAEELIDNYGWSHVIGSWSVTEWGARLACRRNEERKVPPREERVVESITL